MFKSIAAGAVITIGAGVIATGGAVIAANPFAAATYLHHTSPGAAYGMAVYEHADPLHSDPGGEFIQIRAADNGGTASTFYQIGPYVGGLSPYHWHHAGETRKSPAITRPGILFCRNEDFLSSHIYAPNGILTHGLLT